MADKTESKNNGGHFTAVPQEFTRCGTFLSLTEKAVMLYLYSNAKRFNIQGVTRPLIALKAGVSERAVTAALKTLMVKKVIDVCRKNVPGTKKSCLSITLLPFPEVPEQCANFAHANNAHANFAGANFAHIDPSCTVDPSSSTRSTSSTVDHSLKSTTTAAPPTASERAGSADGAGESAEPSSDVLDDVYQEFAEKRREGEFDRFLRYNRKTGWQMSAYDAAAEWLSKPRPERSRKPKGSGGALPRSSAELMEETRAMCGRLRQKDSALAVSVLGWLSQMESCFTGNPGDGRVERKFAKDAQEFLRRCREFLAGGGTGLAEFVAGLA